MELSRISTTSPVLKTTLCALAMLVTASASADLDRAKQLINAGDSDAALIELESEIARNPNAEAEFLRAVTLQGVGKRSQAMEAYAQMIQSYPELPEPYNNLAVMHAEDKNFEKAVQMLKRAISTNDSYATAYENLGDIHSQQASDAYNQALALGPANSQTVEIKLNLIDNILLPPNLRKPVLQASSQQTPAPTQSAAPQTRPSVSSPPNSTAVPATTVSGSERAAVDSVIKGWASAWSNQDVASYLAFYADDFRPVNGASKAAWAQYRAEKLQTPNYINVNVSDLSVSNTARGLRATFAQTYQSDSYQDSVLKSLELINTAQGWKIHSEQSQPL